MNVLVGRGLLHLVQDAGLGRDDERLAPGSTSRSLRSAVVEPMKSAWRRIASSHSGCAMISALGVALHQPDELPLAEGLVDDAAALPEDAGRAAGLLLDEAAEVLVGREEDLLVAAGTARTIFSAFDDVQM